MKKVILCIFAFSFLIGGLSFGLYKHLSPKEITVNGAIAGLTQEELILNSDLIITGTVTKINESKWSNPEKIKDKRNVLQTDVEIEIDDILLGEYDLGIAVVRVNKGYDKKTRIKYISDGYPDFYEGENVLIFLARDDGDLKTDENYFVTVGMYQGKWSLDKESEKIDNERTLENYSLEGRTVGEMKSEVKEQITKNPNYKEERALKREETRKRNIELFGE